MKIIAILSWFDESPSWLATCVTGIGRFCDVVVAVDGAYQQYPAGRPRSHPQQVEAIVHTAEAAGLGCLIYQPPEIWWGNEVEKRNKALDLIGSIAEDGDWLAIIDADYHLLWCKRDELRHALGLTDLDVASYLLLDGKDFQSTEALERYAAQTYIDSEWTVATRDLYRWNPTLRVGPAHFHYSVSGEGKLRRWLRGPHRHLADALAFNSELVFYHRTQDRAEARRQAAKQYYDRRAELQFEAVA